MKTVIEMAREAGFMAITNDDPDVGAWYECFTSEIERFAELVRADEREACAQICEQYADVDTYENGVTLDFHAKLIRERSNT
jgi:hypothetical protein